MIKFEIEPYDVLLFRDGRPFNPGDWAYSIFPPLPSTFQGAIRAKIWMKQDNLRKNLSNPNVIDGWLSPDENKMTLKFYGPFIKKGEEIYFPLPLNLLFSEDGEIYFAEPQDTGRLVKIQNTNIQNIQKITWVKTEKKVEVKTINFISLEGLIRYLNGYKGKDLIENFLSWNEIYINDGRLCININPSSNTVKEEDGVYRVGYVQLLENIKFVMWMEAEREEEKLFELFDKDNLKVLQLGGERRTIKYTVEKHDFKCLFENVKEEIKKKVLTSNKCKILFLTPMDYDKWYPQGSLYSSLNLVGAVVGSDVKIGGWDLQKGSPKVLRRGINAGSVFWYEVKDNNVVDRLWLHMDKNTGFGLKIVGV